MKREQVTEKAVSRLAEETPNYKDKLQDRDVYANIMAVVSRAKRLATPDMTNAVTEWEAQLLKVSYSLDWGTISISP